MTNTATAAQPFPDRAEVVIIGGGIVGCSLAYHLARRGCTDVVLLERRQLTCGTTWHAAGLVAQLRASLNLTRLAQYSTTLYRELAAETGHETGYRQNGALSVATSTDRMVELQRQASMAEGFGLSVRRIDVDEIVARYPIADRANLVGGVWLPTDGQTNPVDTTLALAASARRAGVHIFENALVSDLLHDAGHVAGVVTQHGVIRARRVALCAGMWSRDFAARYGIAVPLHAAEHFYIVTEPIADLPQNLPVWREPDGGFYIKEDAGKLLIGGFELQAKPWGMGGIPETFCFDQLPDDLDHFAPLLERAVARIPLLASAGIKLFFNGPESFTPDNNYIIGPTPELGGLFAAAGFNSIGIQSAGGVGKVLADWMLDGHPGVDLWDVDIRRFHPFQASPAYLRDRTTESVGLLYAMHWPTRQKTTARSVRRTALHHRLDAARACFGEFAGWERPNWFAAPDQTPVYEHSYARENWFAASRDEHHAVREQVGLFDQSGFGKFIVAGADAQRVLDRCSTARVDVPLGRVVYTQWLNPRGGIEADLTIVRTGAAEFLVVSAAATQRRDPYYLREAVAPGEHCTVVDVTSAFAVIGLMGPQSRHLLQRLTDADLRNEAFPFRSSREIFVGYAGLRATRITYVGELGWELYIPTEFATHVYDRIVEAGADFGLRLAGYHAMNSLRLEKAYRHWGHDIDTETTPLEAGLSFTIAWDKPGGFIGRDALLRQKQAGVCRRLAQFRLLDPEPLLFHDEPVWRNGERVGRITSGAYGHTIGAAIGLGYVNATTPLTPQHVRDGNYSIEIGDRMVPAAVSLRPLYDADNAKVLA